MAKTQEKYKAGPRLTRTFPIAVDDELKTRLDALRERGLKVSAWARDLITSRLHELEEAQEG